MNGTYIEVGLGNIELKTASLFIISSSGSQTEGECGGEKVWVDSWCDNFSEN